MRFTKTGDPTGALARTKAMVAVSDPYVGAVVGKRYRVIRKIGQGGMGTVYSAEHVVIGKRVALKILSLAGGATDLPARFLQEARTASMIEHPNVINVTDFGHTDGGSVFIAMEFLDGIDLAQRLRSDGPMRLDAALRLFRQLCAGVGAAHDRGIVHRDLKPQNVFLVQRADEVETVKILDFGIAKLLGATDASRRTREGFAIGTPEYMSPEQCLGDPLDLRTDVYAAGCMLYEMLTGRLPFAGSSPVDILEHHVFRLPPPPSLAVPMPGHVERAILKALSKQREDRFESLQAFCAALEETAESKAEQVMPTLEVFVPRSAVVAKLLRRHRRAVAVGLGLGLVAGVALLAARHRPPASRTDLPIAATPRPGQESAAPSAASHAGARVSLPSLAPTAQSLAPTAPSPARPPRFRPAPPAPRTGPRRAPVAPTQTDRSEPTTFRKVGELINPFDD